MRLICWFLGHRWFSTVLERRTVIHWGDYTNADVDRNEYVWKWCTRCGFSRPFFRQNLASRDLMDCEDEDGISPEPNPEFVGLGRSEEAEGAVSLCTATGELSLAQEL